MTRDYDNTSRRAAKRQTSQRIVDEAETLILERPLSEITLNDVADSAGVSVQTVIRHFGGRQGLLEAVADSVRQRIAAQRNEITPGDVEGAVDNLLEHYEAEGDLVLRILHEEPESSFAADAATYGREFHKDWLERAFGPLLDEQERRLGQEAHTLKKDALLVATDLFTWRLLRRDHGASLEHTRNVILMLIRSTLEIRTTQEPPSS